MTLQNVSRDESRTASRFVQEAGTQYAAIWDTPGDERLVEVFDESLHGVCLVTSDPQLLQLGREWHIAYAGSYSLGVVRHVEPQSDGRYHVGLECRDLGPDVGYAH